MTNRICNLLIIEITLILCFLLNALAADDDIIGSWVDENPNNPPTITIYKENDKILYYRDFGEGTIWLGFLVNKSKRRGKTIFQPVSPENGEKYIINKKKEFVIQDNDGIKLIAKPME